MTSASSPAVTDRYLAEAACRKVVLQAAQFVDSHDYAAFASMFSPDGVLQRPGGTPLMGRAAILAAYASRPAGRMTRHLVTNTVVNIESDGAASALSYVLLWSGDSDAESTPLGRAAHGRQVVGEFADNFERLDGHWLIARREARFVLYIGDV